MKATLAMIACLAMAGFLTAAATVTGNNTAVVIQKAKVESKNGWQLLCVPVTALQINGATSETAISIDDILPPESYPVDAQVYIDGSAFATLTSVGTTKSWVTSATTRSADDLKLPPGQVFWLKKPAGEDNQMPTATTFCGQEKRAATRERPRNGQMVLMRNDSDQPLKISEVMGANAKDLDEILRIKQDSLDYYSFTYFTPADTEPDKSKGWYDAPAGYTAANDVTIAPGEAFYYFASSASGN